MHRLQWQEFRRWLTQKDKPTNYPRLVEALQLLRGDLTRAHVDEMINLPEFQELECQYAEFCKDGTDGPLKIFWNSYLEMVSTLLCLIRATREGDWELHLECIKAILPWFFAYDHTNYARYLPVYLLHMLSLSQTHPEAYDMLSKGDFGVQRNNTHGFSKLPVDQTIEQTLNRNTKTKGGIVGFSLKRGAVQRWMLTAHARATFIDRCREMASLDCKDDDTHKECGAQRLKRDEEDVQKVMEVIQQWRNPFEPSDELMTLSSGCVASGSVKDDLLNAEEKGKFAFASFVSNRLTSTETGFFETLPKLKLGRFGEVKKKVSAGGRTFVIRADRNLFARLLVIGQNRQIDLRELLSFELGPVPWSLASCDGSLAKTTKSSLIELLEDDVEPLQQLPNASVFIIDAMALLQGLTSIPERFSALAMMTLNTILRQSGQCTRIDFVADQYPTVSIKNAERERRGRDGQLIVKIESPNQRCPRQWSKFLASGCNKMRLVEFFVCEWGNNQHYATMLGNRSLYVAHGELCTKIVVDVQGNISSSPVPELFSNQEEADTRMFLHAAHASDDGHQQIIIKSSDTDVEVLSCYLNEHIQAEVTLLCATQKRSRAVSVSQICQTLGTEVCRILPSLHAMTGCDSVSSFAGKGKKSALDIVMADAEQRAHISTIGDNLPPKDDDLRKAERFICALYGDESSSNVNSTRYRLFCRNQKLQSHHLPPTRAALRNHMARANYQAYIWKRALTAQIPNQNPDGQGWRRNEDDLKIDWTDLAPAPESVMQLVCCGCKGKCDTRQCSCVKTDLRCTDACSCQDQCENTDRPHSDTDDDDSEEEGE